MPAAGDTAGAQRKASHPHTQSLSAAQISDSRKLPLGGNAGAETLQGPRTGSGDACQSLGAKGQKLETA